MLARLNPLYSAIAITLFVIGVYGYGYYRGYSNQKEKFDAFVLQTKANAELQTFLSDCYIHYSSHNHILLLQIVQWR